MVGRTAAAGGLFLTRLRDQLPNYQRCILFDPLLFDLEQLREWATDSNTVRFTCAESLPGNGVVYAHVLGEDLGSAAGDGTEKMSLSRGALLTPALDALSQIRDDATGDNLRWLTSAPLAKLTETTWHELMHTKGFMHPQEGYECDAEKENTMPYLLPFALRGVAHSAWHLCDQTCPSPRQISIQAFAESSPDSCRCTTDPGVYVPGREESGPYVGTNQSNDEFGRSIAAGDFDGDGVDDLVVAIPRSAGTSPGSILEYRGGFFGLRPVREISISSETATGFGFALATGDFDNDGYGECQGSCRLRPHAAAA